MSGSLAAGLSVVRLNGSFGSGLEGGTTDEMTVGIPIEMGLSVRGAHVGGGLKVFLNINPEESIAGVGLDLQLGDLR